MFIHEVKGIRVRYADTDQMGYVYYGNYARYYEIGRVEALRSLDFHYKAMEDSGVMMPVYECHYKYLKPARYDDELNILVKIAELPGVRIRFAYEIRNQERVCSIPGIRHWFFSEWIPANYVRRPISCWKN